MSLLQKALFCLAFLFSVFTVAIFATENSVEAACLQISGDYSCGGTGDSCSSGYSGEAGKYWASKVHYGTCADASGCDTLGDAKGAVGGCGGSSGSLCQNGGRCGPRVDWNPSAGKYDYHSYRANGTDYWGHRPRYYVDDGSNDDRCDWHGGSCTDVNGNGSGDWPVPWECASGWETGGRCTTTNYDLCENNSQNSSSCGNTKDGLWTGDYPCKWYTPETCGPQRVNSSSGCYSYADGTCGQGFCDNYCGGYTADPNPYPTGCNLTCPAQTLTVSKVGTGIGTVTSNPAGISCGTTCTVNYAYKTGVTLTESPDASSTFLSWTGNCAGSSTTCSLTLNQTRSATVTFNIKTYTVTAGAGAGGSISPSGPVSVNYGTDKTFTITPNTDYIVSDVLVNGSSVGAVGTYTFTNVKSDQTISASFFMPTGTLSGSIFFDDGTGGGGAYDGIKNGGEPNSQAGVISLSYRKNDGTTGSVSLTGGSISQALPPGSYRLELTLDGLTKTRTKWNTGSSASNYYYAAGYKYYTGSSATDYPLTITVDNTTSVFLGVDHAAPTAPALTAPVGQIAVAKPTFTATDNSPANSFPEGYHNWHVQVLNSSGTVIRELCWPSPADVPGSTVQTTPSTGSFAFSWPASTLTTNGCAWNALPLAEGDYTWKAEMGTGTNTQLGSGFSTTTFKVVTTAVISGNLFDDGPDANGFIDSGDSNTDKTSSSQIFAVRKSDGSATTVTAGSCPSANCGKFTFTGLVPDVYRLEILPQYAWQTTKWSSSGSAIAYSYGSSGSRFYTKQMASDYPFTLAAGGTATANLGIMQLATNALTIQLYNDVGSDGITATDGPLTGSPTTGMTFDCSPGGGPCVSGLMVNATNGRVVISGLAVGSTTINYNAGGSGYQYVTDIIVAPSGDPETDCTGGATIPKPPTCTFNFTKSTVLKVGLTSQTMPWIQVWDGDVYSNYSASASIPGIRISVNDTPTNPPYHTAFVQTDQTNAGGITVTRTGGGSAFCNGHACSENGWHVDGHSGLDWPVSIDNIDTNGTNVYYIVSDYTLDAGEKNKFQSGGDFFRKIVVINGNLTIRTNGVAGGGNDYLNAFLVAKGNINITGPASANELVIKGGLYAKEGITFDYSLVNNRTPAVVIIYDPSLLLGY